MADYLKTTRDSVEYESQGLKIFGVIHRGMDPTKLPCPGIVMYHGYMASKCQPPHRLFVPRRRTSHSQSRSFVTMTGTVTKERCHELH